MKNTIHASCIASVLFVLACFMAAPRAGAAALPSEVRDRAGAVLLRLAQAPPSNTFTLYAPRILRSSMAGPRWVDSDGVMHDGPAPLAAEVVDSATTIVMPAAATDVPPPLATITIDRMTTSSYTYGYTPYREFRLFGSAQTYFLSDGTSWWSGAGSYSSPFAVFTYAETRGDTTLYHFTPEPDSLVYAQTDYDSGSQSSQGSLTVYSELVLRAVAGSSTAVMTGHVRIRDNTMTWYGEPAFNFFSALPGSVVPFTLTYTNQTGPWTFTTLDAPFSYSSTGTVDFAHPISQPALLELTLRGSRQVPAGQSTQFGATARFEGGVLRDVRQRATWSVSPPLSASISNGLLTVPAIGTPRLELLLSVSYTAAPVTLATSMGVSAIGLLDTSDPNTWPMYQADFAHTGYRPLTLSTGIFTPRWQRNVGNGYALNPATAADGRVFCSIVSYFPPPGTPEVFCLSAVDGSTLWSKSYGSVFSVNPPAYAYGNVYVQSGDHASDTYLHAIDAASGVPVFDAPHSAQWERYYAPTISQGKVFVDGGYYGGMYGFDAFSGAQNWFNSSLPQYDGWTPALDDSNAYAHLGDYAPGLYVVSRTTGILRFSIIDPSFSWNGWSMAGSPVVCGNGDVIAAHDTRLICFNIPTHSLVWQLARAFSGQPSYHGGVIYAIDGGRLVAINEQTHADLWSWQPPGGGLAGALIVTDSHVLVSTPTTTYAVSLASHASEWSYGAGGALALADNSLYIATSGGMLHAVTVSDHPVATTLQYFSGAADAAGVRLSWQFADPQQVASVELQRSEFDTGPWAGVNAGQAAQDGTVSALDVDVEPGHSYWYRLSARFTDGSRREFEPVRVTLAATLALNQLRVLGASPAGGPLRIRFGSARDGWAKLSVLDAGGRLVATLANGDAARGAREAVWTGASSSPPGMYFVFLDAPGYRDTRKIVIAR